MNPHVEVTVKVHQQANTRAARRVGTKRPQPKPRRKVAPARPADAPGRIARAIARDVKAGRVTP